MQRYEIMPFEDLWIGEMLGVEVGGIKILLLNVEDEVRAYLDRCPHRASALSEGSSRGPHTNLRHTFVGIQRVDWTRDQSGK